MGPVSLPRRSGAWLERRGIDWGDLGALVGRDPSGLKRAASYSERLVELAGQLIDEDPRLTEQRYPHLAEVV